MAERRLHFGRDRVVDREDGLELVGEAGLPAYRDDLDVVAAGAQRLRGAGLQIRAGAAPAADVGAAQVVGDGDERDPHGARQSGGAGSALLERQHLGVVGRADEAVTAIEVK